MASPAIAPPEVRDVTLSLFAGRKTDIAPSDLPEGLTPDEQDGIYLPGQWQSRPGLARLYAAGKLSAGASVLYEKTYIQPNDDPITLALTSDGKLWAEDVGNNAGNPTQIGSVTPGLYAQSVSAFGREYIAFSDLLHGQGIPLQFDGTNLDRVTQDGPGTPPQVADYVVSQALAASPGGAVMVMSTVAITAYTQVGFVSQVTVSGPGFGANLQVGDSIQIAGAADAGYNGTWVVSAVAQRIGFPGSTTISYVNTASGLPNGGSGTVSSNIAQFTTTAANPFALGNMVAVAGVAVGGYNGTWQVRQLVSNTVFIAAIGAASFNLANSGGGTAALSGSIGVGAHQFVVMFLTRQGAITKPSPAGVWIAGGNQRAHVTNIPRGPSNVVARILGFTGAGGGNFFILPAAVTLPNPGAFPTIVGATVVPDNTSTSYVVDFSDNALFSGVAIDQAGNDLFDQVVIGPVLGFFAYASRLSCWGDYNKVENFLNMGFSGGYLYNVLTAPTGWGGLPATGGTLVNGGPWAGGQSWQITGDGSGSQLGLITQSAYQDSFGDAIISPNTQYSVRLWAKASTANLAGNLFVVLSSASTAFSSQAVFAMNALSASGGLTALVALSAITPAVIPNDLILSVYEIGLPNAATVIISELEIIFTANPYRDHLSRWSYVLNPEAFAGTTGNLGPDDDESPIRCFALLRESALLQTAEGIHGFSDNTNEPDEWNVKSITRAVGALSLRAGDPGKAGTGDAAEDWALVASKNAVYLFAGSEFWPVSQEISRGATPQSQDPRKTWDDINWAAQHTIVAKNDPTKRRAYFAVPINGATTPNVVFVLDYRELVTAAQIASSPPLHITIQGKMRSSDLTRKWSVWNIAANDIEILVRPGNQKQLTFAGAPNAQGNAFGNVYTLDPTKLTDDDYGAIAPYYTTYFFTDHDQEQALGIGSDMHLVKHVHSFVTGVGLVTITPIVNSLYNFLPPLSQRALVSDTNQGNFLNSDLEWTGVGIRGQRIAFRISVQPLPGATDVQLKLQKFVVGMMRDPICPFRQSGV